MGNGNKNRREGEKKNKISKAKQLSNTLQKGLFKLLQNSGMFLGSATCFAQ